MNLIPGVIDLLDEIEWASVRNELPVVSFATGAAYHKGLRLSTSDFGIRHKTAGRLTRYLIKALGFDCIGVAGLLHGVRSDEPDEPDEPDEYVAYQRIMECLRREGAAFQRVR